MSTTEIRVAGLDCKSCVAGIEAGLKHLNGVENVQVDLSAGLARIQHAGDGVSGEDLEREIERLGFRVARDKATAPAMARMPRIPPLVLIAGFLAALPPLYALRNQLVYTPGEDALFVPGSLDLDTFDTVSLVAVGVAFLAGVAVFFSPAMFAMVGVVVGYTGSTTERSRADALRVAAGFAVGLTLVDAAVGAAFGGIGKSAVTFLTEHLGAWNLLVSILLLATGLLLLRVWHLHVPGVAPRQMKVDGFRGAFLLSAPFGLIDCPGCTPLLFPVAIGVAIAGDPLFGALVMGAYGLGRGVLLTAVGASAGLMKQLRAGTRLLPVIETAGGVLLLLAGLYFFKEFLRIAEVSGL